MNGINFLFFVLSLTFTRAEAFPADIGFLAGSTGPVRLNGVKAKNGDPLTVGSRIVTGEKGKVQILLGDGIVALVGYNSRIQLEHGTRDTAQFELLSGSLRLLVSEAGGVHRSAVVRSGDAFATVSGGEGHFQCDSACEQKVDETRKLKRISK